MRRWGGGGGGGVKSTIRIPRDGNKGSPKDSQDTKQLRHCSPTNQRKNISTIPSVLCNTGIKRADYSDNENDNRSELTSLPTAPSV